MGFSSSYIGVPMLYAVFAFWAGATIAIMGRKPIEFSSLYKNINLKILLSPYGGSLCISTHPPSPLGGVPVKIL